MMTVVDLAGLNNLLEYTQNYEFKSIHFSHVSYATFFNNYLASNRPCIIEEVTSVWPCQKEWICDGKPNFSYLKKKYGVSEVPVANCNDRYFNSQSKKTMRLEEYLSYWEKYILQDYPNSSPSLYLKDWHFFREFSGEQVYSVPFPFISDWLNEYFLSSPDLLDDYRFVYMGPKGTWTPLHKDVFSSFSWSVNLCGSKEWWFYPPEEEEKLKDSLGNLVYDVRSEESRSQCLVDKATCIRLIQGQGDAVFVPSGWYHQVWNLADTISINHNWINGCNIMNFYKNLQEELSKVEKEISDCKESPDWTDMCQNLLRASFGFNIRDFIKLLECIIKRRIMCLESEQLLSLPCGSFIGLNHIKFDLKSTIPVLSLLSEKECEEAKELLSKLSDLTWN